MRLDPRTLLALTVAGALFQSTSPAQAAKHFAAPVRLMAGDMMLGEGRLYPSPVCQDMNGDGLADIVVGDLFGHLTVALRVPGGGTPTFGKETKLKALDGKELDFGNW